MSVLKNDTDYSASISVEVNTKDKSDVWLKVFETNVKSALGAMADAIQSRALMTVPRKTGNLANSGRVGGQGLERTVTFGGGNILYGDYQERGMRIDGSRVVTHYTTAGTGARYLETAFDTVVKEGIGKYIK